MTRCMGILLLVTTVICQSSARSAAIDNFNRFSTDVYKEVKKNETGNLAISPISTQILLALAYQGAEGLTAEELSATLHLQEDKTNIQEAFPQLTSGVQGDYAYSLSRALYLQEDKTNIQEAFTQLTSGLQGDYGYSLSSANKIYVKDGYKIKDAFKKTAEDNFQAEIDSIDFLSRGAVEEINEWVANKTNGTIKDLVTDGDFAEDTGSLFINGLSFKGVWRHQFGDTFKKLFYVDNETMIEVDTMLQDEFFEYHESKELDAKFLVLPFETDDASMTFVLPNDRNGLNFLEDNINDVFAISKYDHYTKIEVQIPKFKIESTINFKNALQNLGVEKAFTNTAEFPGIIENEAFKIEKVLQKTFLDVHETGVTAAVATKATFHFYSGPEFDFIANHPFLYYIKVKDAVIFVGRYVSP